MVTEYLHAEMAGKLSDNTDLMFSQGVKELSDLVFINDQGFQSVLHAQQRVEPFKEAYLEPPV